MLAFRNGKEGVPYLLKLFLLLMNVSMAYVIVYALFNVNSGSRKR